MTCSVLQSDMVRIPIIFEYKVVSYYVGYRSVPLDIREVLIIFDEEGQGSRGERFGGAAREEEGVWRDCSIWECTYAVALDKN